MPPRPKTTCRKVACGALIEAPGYCEKHAKQSVGWNRTHGDLTSAQRGYGYQWQKRREQILKRDCGLCQIKGEGCRIIATEVDHKVNKEAARNLKWTDEQIDAEENLQAACSTCHRAKTQRERVPGASKFGASSL